MRVKKQFCIKGHNIKIFGRNKHRICNVCHGEWANNNRELVRNANRKSNWKLCGIINTDGSIFGNVDYYKLYKIQQGKCAICKVHAIQVKQRLCVDHNHKVGSVRGLLCISCNTKLGMYV